MTDLETLVLYTQSELNKIHPFKGEAKEKAAAAMFTICIEHAESISMLLSKRKLNSAMSLLRVLFECFVRASWILECATEKEVSKLIYQDKVDHHFSKLVAAVDESLKQSGRLLNLQNQDWKILNSLTHTGTVPLLYNFDGKSIKQRYSSEHEAIAISYVIYFLRLSFLLLCDLSNISPEELERSYSGFLELEKKCN